MAKKGNISVELSTVFSTFLLFIRYNECIINILGKNSKNKILCIKEFY